MRVQTWPFLVVYHRKTGAVEVTKFDEFHDAFAERLRLERERTDPDVEIVVIRTDSIDTLQDLHSRYFMGGDVRIHA